MINSITMLTSSELFAPERRPDESFEAYKSRRAQSQKVAKRHTKGTYIYKNGDPMGIPFGLKNTKHTRAGSKKRMGAL